VRDLDDTQPSRSDYMQNYNVGVKGPPRVLLWGVILFALFIVVGVAGVFALLRFIVTRSEIRGVDVVGD